MLSCLYKVHHVCFKLLAFVRKTKPSNLWQRDKKDTVHIEISDFTISLILVNMSGYDYQNKEKCSSGNHPLARNLFW